MEDFRKSTSTNVREKEKVNKECNTGSDKSGKEMEEDFLSFGFFFFSRSFDFGVSFGIFGSGIRVRLSSRFMGSFRGRLSVRFRGRIRGRIGDGDRSGIFNWLLVIIFF